MPRKRNSAFPSLRPRALGSGGGSVRLFGRPLELARRCLIGEVVETGEDERDRPLDRRHLERGHDLRVHHRERRRQAVVVHENAVENENAAETNGCLEHRHHVGDGGVDGLLVCRVDRIYVELAAVRVHVERRDGRVLARDAVGDLVLVRLDDGRPQLLCPLLCQRRCAQPLHAVLGCGPDEGVLELLQEVVQLPLAEEGVGLGGVSALRAICLLDERVDVRKVDGDGVLPSAVLAWAETDRADDRREAHVERGVVVRRVVRDSRRPATLRLQHTPSRRKRQLRQIDVAVQYRVRRECSHLVC